MKPSQSGLERVLNPRLLVWSAPLVLAISGLGRVLDEGNSWWTFSGGVGAGLLVGVPILLYQRWRAQRRSADHAADPDLVDERHELIRLRSWKVGGQSLASYLVVILILGQWTNSKPWISESAVLLGSLGLLLFLLSYLATMVWSDRFSRRLT